MNYEIEFKPKAVKDLKSLEKKDIKNIIEKIEEMKKGISNSDIKKLTNFTPEYRLRAGNYRILFEITGNVITILYNQSQERRVPIIGEKNDRFTP